MTILENKIYTKKLYPLICISILIIIEINLSSVSAQQPTQDIEVSPSTINIRLHKKLLGMSSTDNQTITIHIRSLFQNVTVVDFFVDPFFEELNRRPPIDIKYFPFKIIQKNLTSPTRVELQITFNIKPNIRSGSYKSKLYVTSSSGSISDIPLNLIISASEWWILIWLFVGVILNLALFLINDIGEYRETLRENVNATDDSIEKAYYSISEAYDKNKDPHLVRVTHEFTDLINEWNIAILKKKPIHILKSLAKKSERIIDLAKKATSIPDGKKNVLRHAIEQANVIIDEAYKVVSKAYEEKRMDDDHIAVRDFIILLERWNEAIDSNGNIDTFEKIIMKANMIVREAEKAEKKP